MSPRLIEAIPHIHAGLVSTIAQAQETLKQAQEALRILDAADGPPWNTDDKGTPAPSEGVIIDQMTDGSVRDYRKPAGDDAARKAIEAIRDEDGNSAIGDNPCGARAILAAIRSDPWTYLDKGQLTGYYLEELRGKLAAAQTEINRLLAESLTADKYVKEQYAAYEAKLAAEREELFKSRCRADESCAQRERLGKALCALMGMPFPPPIQDIDAMRVALSAVPAPDATASEAALLALEALRVFTPGPSVTGLPQDERDRLTGGGR